MLEFIDRRLVFSKKNLLAAGAVVLLWPALLVHLGLVALYSDEGIRALVALEMDISGNYIVPTLFGELYHNKPPLYNWLLLLVFKLMGNADEFTARLPTVVFLLAFAISIYFFVKKMALPAKNGSGIDRQMPLLTAFAFITSGRVLFWDSMLALIDICFSWVMYVMCMIVYRLGEKQSYGRLFTWAYLLAGLGFLLKGLPAVVCLGLALPLYFFWQKKGRLLFSWTHLGGIVIFVLVVGGYYACYAQRAGLDGVFATLFNESAKRTFVQYGLGDTLLHLLTFPFEFIYHFLPWTLLAVYFFGKNAFQHIRRNKFITWNLLLLLVTVLPYWSSVEIYPRYLFMQVPLLFTVLLYLHFENKNENTTLARWVEAILFVGCLAALGAVAFPLFWSAVRDIPFLYPKTVALLTLLTLFTLLYRRWPAHRMMVLVLVLLTLRIGYNWFVLPTRLDVECSTQVRRTTLEAVGKLEGRPLFIYKNSLGLQPVTGYYFTRETGHILREVHEDFDMEACYLVNVSSYGAEAFEVLDEVRIHWKCGQLQVARLRTTN